MDCKKYRLRTEAIDQVAFNTVTLCRAQNNGTMAFSLDDYAAVLVLARYPGTTRSNDIAGPTGPIYAVRIPDPLETACGKVEAIALR